MNNNIIISNEQVKQIAYNFGADLCGLASVDSFKDAPKGFHPLNIFPECRTVAVIAIKMPEGVFLGNSKIPYTVTNDKLLDEIVKISISMSIELERNYNINSIPIPGEPYEYWDEENKTGRGILSLKHSGRLAGLGTIGKNSLLTNKMFGNRIVLGAVLIDQIITADSIDNDPVCIEGCSLCEKNCAVNAISNGSVNQKLCRGNSCLTTDKGYFIYTCFECRVICPKGKGSSGRN